MSPSCRKGSLSPLWIFLWVPRDLLTTHTHPGFQYVCVCVCAYVCAQSSPTLCDSMDCSLPGSSIHGILQTRILEWVAMPSSRGSSWPFLIEPTTLVSPALTRRFLPLSHLGNRILMCVFKWSPDFLGYSDLKKKNKQTKQELCLSPLFYLMSA